MLHAAGGSLSQEDHKDITIVRITRLGAGLTKNLMSITRRGVNRPSSDLSCTLGSQIEGNAARAERHEAKTKPMKSNYDESPAPAILDVEGFVPITILLCPVPAE
jgi:hypothetical protein